MINDQQIKEEGIEKNYLWFLYITFQLFVTKVG